ncbi:hypothetical protein Syun_031883 [Stephania yunnanensis]|uniref:Uncharacterized protein n=1 Tax=Stephania yunnanensis TaxID=152371 RepID=A0AAP0DXE4_9MAGN
MMKGKALARPDEVGCSTQEGPRKSVPSPSPEQSTRWPLSPRERLERSRRPDGFGTRTPCPTLEPILFPKLRIHFADFPCLHSSIDREHSPWRRCGYEYGRARTILGPPDFQGRGAAGHHQRAVLFRPLDHYLRAEPFPGWAVLNEKITLPEAPPDVSDSQRCVSRRVRFGNFNRFPFEARAKHAFETGSADGSSPGSRPRFYGYYAAPSYSSGLDNCPDGGCGLRASAPSISGLVDSAGELLHTP